MDLSALLAYELLGNPGERWLMAVGAFVVALFVLVVVRSLAGRRLRAFARRTSTIWDDGVAELIGGTRRLFLLIVAVFVGALFLDLPGAAQRVVRSVTLIALVLQVGLWSNYLIRFWLSHDIKRRKADDPASVATVSAVGFIARLILWSLVLLLVLDNLGFNVTALVAGLGVGGIAIALAVQNILGDLFASLSIVLDKPFAVGDFLIIGEFMGSVEHVGLKTTRMRSLSGEQLIFSNNDLLGSRIRNYGRMYERRVVFKIGVTYQTPRDKLMAIPKMIREIVEAQERTRFDRYHFQAYGAFSLDFETVYYVTVPDYNAYMDVQQAINFAIHERFEAQGIEFAYPTQTLFLEHASSNTPADPAG
jgi:small-conductance mechanosensitive channel